MGFRYSVCPECGWPPAMSGTLSRKAAAFDALLDAAQELDDAFNWLLDDVAVSYADAFKFRAAIESAKKAVGADLESGGDS